MKDESKIFYETLLKEREEELIDIIQRYEITKIIVRPCLADIKSKRYDFMHIYKSFDSIYIRCITILFEMKLLNCEQGCEADIEDAFMIFCRYFRKLIKEVNNDFRK